VISRLSDRTTMYHNALIVALRTAPGPLSAAELVADMPWVQQTRQHPTYRGPRCTALPRHRTDHGRLVRCDGITHIVEVRPAGYQIYAFMCRLERDGLVARAAGSVEGRRIVWELTDHGRASADIDDVRRIVDPRLGEKSPDAPDSAAIDLEALSKAVAAHLDRLGIARSDFARVAKVAEEGGEVLGALLKRDECRTTTADVLDELGDVFLAALAACDQLGVAPSAVISQRWATVSKRSHASANGAGVGEDR
jgi:hypothetical protein